MDFQLYTVKGGDTLRKIARDVLGDLSRWSDIARLNNLVRPYTIIPGMQLTLPDTEVLGPVVVAAKRRPDPDTTRPVPRVASVAFDLTPQQWMYVVLGAAFLFLFLDQD